MSNPHSHQLTPKWIIATAVLALGLGIAGFHLYDAPCLNGNSGFGRDGSANHWLDSILGSVEMFEGIFIPHVAENGKTLHPPLLLNVARILAAIVLFYLLLTRVFKGIWRYVRLTFWKFSNLPRNSAAKTRNAQNQIIPVKTSFFRREYQVVCGLGERGLGRVKQLREEGKRVVIIENNPDCPRISVAVRRGKGPVPLVFIGDALNENILRRAGISEAAEIHIYLPNDNLSASAAIACGHVIEKSSTGRLRHCDVHVQFARSATMFENHPSFQYTPGKWEVRIKNDNDNAARQILIKHIWKIIRVSGKQDAPHILLVGAGRLGQSLLVRMAHLLHLGSGKPPFVTVVEKDKNKEREFHAAYPFIKANNLLELNFIPDGPDINCCDSDLINSIHKKHSRIDGVFFCISNEMAAYSAACLLRTFIGNSVPIIICTDNGAGLAKIFAPFEPSGNPEQKLPENILLKNTFVCNVNRETAEDDVRDAQIEGIAVQLHEDYRETQTPKNLKANKPEVPSWDKISLEERESNREQASGFFLKLSCFGYSVRKREESCGEKSSGTYWEKFLENKEILARMEHRRWMIFKYLRGWKFGEKTCNSEKINKDLVEWGALEDKEKKKDYRPLERMWDLLKGENQDYVIEEQK